MKKAKDIAGVLVKEIADLMLARDMDWERLEYLLNVTNNSLCEREEIRELKKQSFGFGSKEKVEAQIHEMPLEIKVRSGWNWPFYDLLPEDYCVLFSNGGPALRIVGKLDSYMEPYTAIIEVQEELGTPWVQFDPNIDKLTLLNFMSIFNYGGNR